MTQSAGSSPRRNAKRPARRRGLSWFLTGRRSGRLAKTSRCSRWPCSMRRARGMPVAQDKVHFTLEGAGRIIGVGNGDPSCHEPDTFVLQMRTRTVALDTWRWQQSARAAGLAPHSASVKTEPSAQCPGLQSRLLPRHLRQGPPAVGRILDRAGCNRFWRQVLRARLW